jgi:hypothetical protein
MAIYDATSCPTGSSILSPFSRAAVVCLGHVIRACNFFFAARARAMTEAGRGVAWKSWDLWCNGIGELRQSPRQQ